MYGDMNFLEPSLTYGEDEPEAGAGDGFAAAEVGAAGVVSLPSLSFSPGAEAPVVGLASAMLNFPWGLGLQVVCRE